jgi:dTDP-4-dehydrorhamnose reductase
MNNVSQHIVILGKGYIGTYLACYLKKTSLNVTHVSKNDVDYTDPIIFKEFITKQNSTLQTRIDWIINCSAYTGNPNIDSCEDNKEICFNYNVLVPLHLTKTANLLRIPIIHFSTGCLYQGYDKIYTEQDLPNFGIDCFDSPFYSKTKDCFERLSVSMDRYIFRIRLPFNSVYEQKNYLYKLINYNNITSKQNSITCVDDLLWFVGQFIQKSTIPESGVYNVVNQGSVDNFDVIDMLKSRGFNNKKWKFVSQSEVNTVVKRSNCLLSTEKIDKIGLLLPTVQTSLEKAIDTLANILQK